MGRGTKEDGTGGFSGLSYWFGTVLYLYVECMFCGCSAKYALSYTILLRRAHEEKRSFFRGRASGGTIIFQRRRGLRQAVAATAKYHIDKI